jgi:hypothetical protein
MLAQHFVLLWRQRVAPLAVFWTGKLSVGWHLIRSGNGLPRQPSAGLNLSAADHQKECNRSGCLTLGTILYFL